MEVSALELFCMEYVWKAVLNYLKVSVEKAVEQQNEQEQRARARSSCEIKKEMAAWLHLKCNFSLKTDLVPKE